MQTKFIDLIGMWNYNVLSEDESFHTPSWYPVTKDWESLLVILAWVDAVWFNIFCPSILHSL